MHKTYHYPQDVDAIANEIYQEVVQKSQKPSFSILAKESQEDVPVLVNKFGGIPYLPQGTSLPRDSRGNILGLFMQLDLGDIYQKLEGELSKVEFAKLFPNTGILQIWLADTQHYGHNLETPAIQDGFRIVYHPNVDEWSIAQQDWDTINNEYIPAVENFAYSPLFDGYLNAIPLKVVESTDCVNGTNPEFPHFFYKAINFLLGNSEDYLKGLEGKKLQELFTQVGERTINTYNHSTLCKLGGYPYFVNGGINHNPEYQTMNVLLLQISSIYWKHSTKRLWFPRNGVVNFFVNPEETSNGNFDNVFYNLEY